MKIKNKGFVVTTMVLAVCLCLLYLVVWHIYSENNKKPLYDLRASKTAKINDDLQVFRGDMSENMTLVVSGNEAAIIDTGAEPVDDSPKRGSNLLKAEIEKRGLKLRNIFYTHYHTDHFSGTHLFIQDIPKNSIHYYDPYNTKDGQIITMGDKTFKVLVTPGHAKIKGGHISIELVEEHILISGDVVYTNFIPLIYDEDSPMDALNTLNRFKKEKYRMIIPGHGNIMTVSYTLSRPIKYLENAEMKVASIIASDGNLDDVRRNLKMQDCLRDLKGLSYYDCLQMHRDNLRQIYAEQTGQSLAWNINR